MSANRGTRMASRLFIWALIVISAGAALFIHAPPAVLAQGDFAGGAGTEADPYLVATAAHLDNVRHHLDAHFRQTADINLGVAPFGEGEGWQPIGSQANPFTGSFNGDGYVIFNLTIDRPNAQYQGLFGYLSGATVERLYLENVTVRGGGYIGALAGYAYRGVIDKVRVTGRIDGNYYTGGVAGSLYESTMHYAASAADVHGTQYSGGLVGSTFDARVYHAYSLGTVEGSQQTGGLIGYAGTSSVVVDSYSRAAVGGSSAVGGLAGQTSGSSLLRSYSTGVVTATTTTNVGGLLGQLVPGTTILDCYWDTETSGQTMSAGGIGKTTAEMQQQSTYQQHNFGTLWHIDEGNDYPIFQDLYNYAPPQAVNLIGQGTPEDPYLIHDADELYAMRHVLTATYRLANDIELTPSVAWDAGRGWTPIGSAGTPFTGTLDGAGYALRNLTISRRGTHYQGFFGYLSGATVRHLRLESARIHGGGYTGGLSGYAQNSTIEDVHVSGHIAGGYETGGLIGYLLDSDMVTVSSVSTVSGTSDHSGGLVGYTRGRVTIQRAFSSGSVNGITDVGGLVGYHYGAIGGPAIIADSYSHAAVSGDTRVGGLVGYNYYGRVYRGYSTGMVTGTVDAGGLIGLHYPGTGEGWITNCYWDTETSGQTTSAGGPEVVGRTTSEMQQRATYRSYRFLALWQIEEGVGYPTFRDSSPTPQLQPLDQVQFAGGSGTESDPFIVTTADQLNAMRRVLTATYRLGNDIDLAGSSAWDLGRGWIPIGDSTQPFSGNLDGAGYTIRNLAINRLTAYHQGLFGNLAGAKVTDLLLEDVSVYAGYQYAAGLAGQAMDSVIARVQVTGEVIGDSNYTGLLVGRADNSAIDSVRVQGKVAGGPHYTGGLVGYQSGGSIHAASSAAEVLGGNYTGGLVGRTDQIATIYHSHSLGAVQGTNYTGGLVGSLWAIIADSYSLSAVSGADSVGGLVGHLTGGTIVRSYSTGAVTGTTNVGGFLGSPQAATLMDCYWDTETSGQPTSAGSTGITGKATSEMQRQSTYARYNFNTLWQIEEGHGYPAFQDLSGHAQPQPVDLADLNGTGVPGDPYIITNADELNAMRQVVTATYRLGSDIDLAATVVWDVGRGWDPVGVLWGPGSDPTQRFTGSLDGAGFAIRNLTVNRPTTHYRGLFGYTQDATIENLRLENISVYGDGNTGGLVGSSSRSTIRDVQVSGEVTGGSGTGGLIGSQSDGSLANVANAAAVKGGANHTGGLVGALGGSGLATLQGAHNLGTVEGENRVGGLVGYLASGTVNDSFGRASVRGTQDVGGLIGSVVSAWASAARVDRSYSTGVVSGTSNVGGLLGYLADGTIADCYWDTETSGQTVSAGGTGKTTTEMQQQATFINWDFTDVWGIVGNETYPYHRDMPGTIALLPAANAHRNSASAEVPIAVTANVTWTATSNDAWIAVTGGTTGRDSGVISYTVAANPLPDLRVGTITVASDDDTITRTFTVRQGAFLTVLPLGRRHDAAASGGHRIGVTGNVTWTAQTPAGWIDVTSGDAGTGDGTVRYRVSENLSLDQRVGAITVSGSGITRTFTVSQAGAIPYLTIAPSYHAHPWTASGGHEIALSANIPWTATTGDGWITGVSGVGAMGDGLVTYSVEANQAPRSRLGAVTISGGNRRYTFRVHQALAWSIAVSADDDLGGTTSGGGHYAHGQPITVTATPNSGYHFAGWTEDGVTVSTTTEYAFTAMRNRALIAVFNQRPVADAGPNQDVATHATVTLDGSGSYDPDGDYPLNYGWTQTGGPQVTFTPTLSVTTFTAPGTPAVLTFTLTVTDSLGLASALDAAVVQVYAPVTDLILHRKPLGELLTGSPVRFTVSADGTRPFTYTWTLDGDVVDGNRDTYEHSFASAGTYTVGITVTNSWTEAYTQALVTVVEPVAGQPDLSLSDKMPSRSFVAGGDVLTYTLLLRNTAEVTATATLTDPLPAYTTYLQGSARASDGGAVTLVGDALVWHGEIISGTPVLIEFAVTVGDAPIGARIVNTATLDDGQGRLLDLVAGVTFNPGYLLTINDGALATDVPTVTLRYAWNVVDAITHVQFSNDGGFGAGASAWLPVNPDDPTMTDWVLGVYGDFRWFCLVFARFRDADGRIYGPILDWIVYDPVGPIIRRVEIVSGIERAQALGDEVIVRITATDDNTGVALVHLSHTEDFASYTEAVFTGPTTDVPWTLGSGGKVYVCAVDRAGNLSAPVSAGTAPRLVFLPLVIRADP